MQFTKYALQKKLKRLKPSKYWFLLKFKAGLNSLPKFFRGPKKAIGIHFMKISKLVLLMSLSNGFAYSITESFSYSRFDIPKDTFKTKIDSKGAGTIWSTKQSMYCYRCSLVASFESPTVKKTVECVDGVCKETYYNPQTGQEIAPGQAEASKGAVSSKDDQKSPILGFIKINCPYVALGALACGWAAYNLYKSTQKP